MSRPWRDVSHRLFLRLLPLPYLHAPCHSATRSRFLALRYQLVGYWRSLGLGEPSHSVCLPETSFPHTAPPLFLCLPSATCSRFWTTTSSPSLTATSPPYSISTSSPFLTPGYPLAGCWCKRRVSAVGSLFKFFSFFRLILSYR